MAWYFRSTLDKIGKPQNPLTRRPQCLQLLGCKSQLSDAAFNRPEAAHDRMLPNFQDIGTPGLPHL